MRTACRARSCCRVYRTSMPIVASWNSTLTFSTAISSASHLVSACPTVNSIAVARMSLPGSNTRLNSPQPNSGKLTRSPGAVNRIWMILARVAVSPPAALMRPASFTPNGKPKDVLAVVMLYSVAVRSAQGHVFGQNRRVARGAERGELCQIRWRQGDEYALADVLMVGKPADQALETDSLLAVGRDAAFAENRHTAAVEHDAVFVLTITDEDPLFAAVVFELDRVAAPRLEDLSRRPVRSAALFGTVAVVRLRQFTLAAGLGPERADPDGKFQVAGFELHPDGSADLREAEKALVAVAAVRDARHRPARHDVRAKHSWYSDAEPAQ